MRRSIGLALLQGADRRQRRAEGGVPGALLLLEKGRPGETLGFRRQGIATNRSGDAPAGSGSEAALPEPTSAGFARFCVAKAVARPAAAGAESSHQSRGSPSELRRGLPPEVILFSFGSKEQAGQCGGPRPEHGLVLARAQAVGVERSSGPLATPGRARAPRSSTRIGHGRGVGRRTVPVSKRWAPAISTSACPLK